MLLQEKPVLLPYLFIPSFRLPWSSGVRKWGPIVRPRSLPTDRPLRRRSEGLGRWLDNVAWSQSMGMDWNGEVSMLVFVVAVRMVRDTACPVRGPNKKPKPKRDKRPRLRCQGVKCGMNKAEGEENGQAIYVGSKRRLKLRKRGQR